MKLTWEISTIFKSPFKHTPKLTQHTHIHIYIRKVKDKHFSKGKYKDIFVILT